MLNLACNARAYDNAKQIVTNHLFSRILMQIEDKISDIESKLAFQEDTIDQLNEQIWQQQQQIALLEKAVKRLAHDMNDSAGSAGDIVDTPPPHY